MKISVTKGGEDRTALNIYFEGLAKRMFDIKQGDKVTVETFVMWKGNRIIKLTKSDYTVTAIHI